MTDSSSWFKSQEVKFELHGVWVQGELGSQGSWGSYKSQESHKRYGGCGSYGSRWRKGDGWRYIAAGGMGAVGASSAALVCTKIWMFINSSMCIKEASGSWGPWMNLGIGTTATAILLLIGATGPLIYWDLLRGAGKVWTLTFISPPEEWFTSLTTSDIIHESRLRRLTTDNTGRIWRWLRAQPFLWACVSSFCCRPPCSSAGILNIIWKLSLDIMYWRRNTLLRNDRKPKRRFWFLHLILVVENDLKSKISLWVQNK